MLIDHQYLQNQSHVTFLLLLSLVTFADIFRHSVTYDLMFPLAVITTAAQMKPTVTLNKTTISLCMNTVKNSTQLNTIYNKGLVIVRHFNGTNVAFLQFCL